MHVMKQQTYPAPEKTQVDRVLSRIAAQSGSTYTPEIESEKETYRIELEKQARMIRRLNLEVRMLRLAVATLRAELRSREPQNISVSPARCRKGEQPPSLHS
jgi:hypothetical protein